MSDDAVPGSRSPGGSASITRRGVLGSGLAVGATAAFGAEGGDPLTLEPVGADVQVTFKKAAEILRWKISTHAFGPEATLLILPPRERPDRRIVRVKRARWPDGGSHELDLCFDGPLTARTFTVEARSWPDVPVFSHVKLDDFLRELIASQAKADRPGAPRRPLAPQAQLQGAAARRFSSTLFGPWLTTEASSLRLRFEGASWLLSAETFRVQPFGSKVADLRLTRELPGSPLLAPLLGVRNVPKEGVWLARGPESPREARVVATVGTGGPRLPVTAGAAEGVLLARFAPDVTVAALSRCRFSLRVEQPRPAGDRRPLASEGPFLLDSERSSLVASGSPSAPDFRLEGALQLKEFSVATLHGRFDVGGLGPSRSAQVIGEAQAGRPLRFEARGALGTVAVPLPDGRDADARPGEARAGLTSRLDLGGQECTFRVGEGTEAPTMPLVRLGLSSLPGLDESDRDWSEADWAVAPVRLPLGAARLRVVRPDDLLALDFRFRGLTLQLRGSVGRLVTADRACGVTVPRSLPGARSSAPVDDRPMLVVDFPPQHVAERAYYRRIEDADLPDPKLTKAEVDKLLEHQGARDRPAEAERRRAKLEEKLKELEETEPPTAPLRTFVKLLADLKPANGDILLGPGGGALARRWASLPVDQQVYLGPEPRLMEADARGIATAIRLAWKRKEAEASAGTAAALADRLPDVPLPRSFVEALALQVKGDAKVLEDELQAERIRRDPDFADFASRYAAAHVPGGAALATFRGRAWFKALDPAPAAVITALTAVVAAIQQEQDYEQFASVTQARLAGVSRLAFRINCDEGAGKRAGGTLPFTLDALTNWSNFDLAVSRRAEVLFETVPGKPDERGPGRSRLPPRAYRAAVGDQPRILVYHGVTPGADLGRRMEEVRGQIVEPSEWETAIELPFRLVLSPSQAARFRLPRAVPRGIFDGPKPDGRPGRTVELWSAALDPDGAAADVRAIWSPDFLHAAFQPGPGRVDPGRGAAWAPWRRERDGLAKSKGERFRTTLEPFDRHELVALTTLRGLPVLGRRSQGGTLTDGSQFEPPPGYSLMPNLQTFDGPRVDQSAIYDPQPLTVPELTLTSLGGSLDLDTIFVPPAAARDKNKRTLYPSLSVERWRHRTVLGRDILVEVVYKGFLFPIGNRCSLVKLTERRFYPHPEGGAPTAFLIQRMFLRIGRPDKRFPALGQPDAGRAFPAELVTFLTRRTPDILDPTTIDAVEGAAFHPFDRITVQPHQNGRLIFNSKENGLVFWPRTARGRAGDVRFQLELDRRVGAVSMPLVFVDNQAANEPEIIEALTHYYNKLDGTGPNPTTDLPDEKEDVPTRRTVNHRGMPRRYAPEYKPGDTTHETSRWILAAQGRRGRVPAVVPDEELAAAATSDFTVDGFMEGADQPPFYPLLEKAKIRITPAERFAGRPLGSVWVQFDRNYVEKGFTKPGATAAGVQDAEGAYLALLRALPLSMGASGDRSGGVARPEMNMIGLSRERGPIGGDAPPAPAVPAAAAVPAAGPAAAPAKAFDRRSVKFDPAKFFNDDAKLLGIISFSDLIKGLLQAQAPELLETVEHAVQQSEEGLTKMAETAREEVVEPLRRAVGDVRKAWEDAARSIAESTSGAGRKLDVQALYPDVGEGLTSLETALLAAEQSTDALGLITSLGPIYESGRRFIAALDRIAADPIAPIRADLLDLLNRLAGDARALIEDAPAFVLGQVRPALETAAADALAKVAADPALQPLRDLLVSLPSPVLPAAVAGSVNKAFDEARAEILGQIIRGKTPSFDDVAMRLTVKLTAIADGQSGAVKQAVLDAADEVEARAAAEVDAFAGPLAARLIAFVTKLAGDYDEVIASLEKDGRRALGNVLGILRQVTLELEELIRALNLGEPLKAACGSVVDELAAYLRAAGEYKDASGKTLADAAKAVAAALPAGDPTRDALKAGLERAARTTVVATGRYEEAREKLVASASLCPSTASLIRVLTDLVASRAAVVAELLATSRLLVAPAPGAVGGDWWADLTEMQAAALRQPMRSLARQLVAAARATLGDVTQARTAANALATGLGDAAKELEKTEGGRALSARVVQPALAAASGLAGALDAAKTALDAAEAALSVPAAAATAAAELAALMNAIGDNVERDLRAALRTTLAELERRLSAGAALAILAQDGIVAALQAASVPLLQPIFVALNPIYAKVEDGRQKVSALPRGDVAGALLGTALAELVVVPEPGGPPGQTIANDALALEALFIKSLATTSVAQPVPTSTAAAFFASMQELAKRWHGQDPALARFVAQVGERVLQVLRGNLVAAIDIQAGRRLVEDRIKSLIPSKVTMQFDLDVPLTNVGKLVQFTDLGDQNLTLHAKAEIDLLKPAAPTFAVEGRVPTMEVSLLPVFDVATLTFKPTSFRAGTGRSADFSVDIAKVKLGEKVSFLEPLSSFLGAPEDGSGFYIRPSTDRLGIVAGYGLALPPFTVGNLGFSNVSLNCACDLPFGPADARFLISIGSRDAPFVIAAAPYAGAGYVGLIANAHGVVGFEASLEYGGGGVFAFGPLKGEGRITVGIYIRQIQGFTELYGLFYCGGSARIACFSASSSFLVRLSQSGGSLQGEATYTFAFSLGFAKARFQIKVWKKESNGGKQENARRTALGDGRVHYALADPGKIKAPPARSRYTVRLVNKATCQGENWGTYASYFDMDGIGANL